MAAVAGALLALFTLADADRLASSWPLGIRDTEVQAYADLLSMGDDTASGKAERYLLTSPDGRCLMDQRGVGWSTHWFEADGFGDSVKVRRLRTSEGGFVIRFQRQEPFRAQRHIVLVPADARSMRAKYLELLARELDLVTPEVSFVRFIACGKDQGLYLKEERIDDDFLEKHGLAGAALAEQGHDAGRPDHLYPAFDDDSLATALLPPLLGRAYVDAPDGVSSGVTRRMDTDALASLIIMAWLEHGASAFHQDHLLAFDWSRGRMMPLYRRARVQQEGAAGASVRMLNWVTDGLRDPAVRRRIRERWESLAEHSWRVRERFAAMDRAWLPILAEGRSLRLLQARCRRLQDGLLGRVRFSTDPLQGLGPALARHAGAAALDAMVQGGSSGGIGREGMDLVSITQRTKAQLRGDTLVFPRGRYAFTSDVVVPAGHAVVLEEGARITLGPQVSFLVQGALQVRGTKRNPVFIRAADEHAPFGSLLVLGDGRTEVRMRGLQMSGGSEARIEGVYASGMLAVHDAASTELSDCVISGSNGEDLLNIKEGTVMLRDCDFADGFADLVDLDRCIGEVLRCRFSSGRKDSNGDGLDVSGARVLVRDCSFERMMDKGISVGEASQLLVVGSRFMHNRAAIVAKDLAIAYAFGNVISGSDVAFAAYRKKPVFGGARVVRYADNVLTGNAREAEADEGSAIISEAAPDEKVRRMFGLP